MANSNLHQVATAMASTIPTVDESAATDANIKALEGLLDEFFRDVSNERKAEIERLLSEFSEQVSEIRLFSKIENFYWGLV